MRPVKAEDVAGLRNSNQILLLNTTVLWFERLDPRRIRGPTGTAPLLIELWARVLHFVTGAGGAPSFIAVTVKSSAPADEGAQRVEVLERRLDEYTDLEGQGEIRRFDQFLERPQRALPPPPRREIDKFEEIWKSLKGIDTKQPTFKLADTEFPEARTFSIVVPNEYTEDQLHARTDLDLLPGGVTLFCDARFEDCHARLGWDTRLGCLMCGGGRFICPGCTGGLAQKYDVFMGCGVDLACPHCLGTGLALDDKDYLQGYYWNSPSVGRERERREILAHRLKELGYADTDRVSWVFKDPALEKEECGYVTDSE